MNNNINYIHLKTNLYIIQLVSKFMLVINSCLNTVAKIYTSSVFREHLKLYLT